MTSQTLIALGPECLAELLLELAGSDPAIKRRIRLAVANAISPEDAAVQVRQRLATIDRPTPAQSAPAATLRTCSGCG